MDDEINDGLESTKPLADAAGPQGTYGPPPSGPHVAGDQEGSTGLRGFIETCGRHPFATGLFAILGVVGLLFSFYAFSVDRAESRGTSEQISEASDEISSVSDSIGSLNQLIVSSDPEVRDRALEVPVAFDWYKGPTDNVVFPASHPVVSRGLTPSEAYAALEQIQASPQSSTYDPFYSFSVSSIASKGFVQIAPYVLVDVFRVAYISEPLAGIYMGERGGSGVLREFSVSLYPRKGVQVAPMIDTMSEEPYKTGIDYISLEPGEVEEYMLYMSYLPGYYYDFRFGLQVKFNGSNFVVWDDREFRRGVPASEVMLYSMATEQFEPGIHPDAAWIVGSEAARDDYYRHVAEDIDQYRRSRVFNLGMAGVEGPVSPTG